MIFEQLKTLTNKTQYRAPLSLAISVLLHLIILVAFSFLSFFDDDFEVLSFNVPERTLEIQEIKREDLQNLRRAGREDSQIQENILTEEEIVVGQEDAEREETQEDAKPGESQGELTMESLGIHPDSEIIVTEATRPPEVSEREEKEQDEQKDVGDLTIRKDPNLEVPFIDRQLAIDQMALKSDILRRMGVGSAVDMARRGNMFMRFDPPQGVDLDELNSIEKMFYGFQVRVFENYIRSLILSYNEVESRSPRLRDNLQGQRYRLSGRVTFDRDGNVTAIRITRWTNQSDVQDMFERSLRKINKIPNIPATLIGDKEEFNIYYVLHIN